MYCLSCPSYVCADWEAVGREVQRQNDEVKKEAAANVSAGINSSSTSSSSSSSSRSSNERMPMNSRRVEDGAPARAGAVQDALLGATGGYYTDGHPAVEVEAAVINKSDSHLDDL
jgi:hypothetical protein